MRYLTLSLGALIAASSGSVSAPVHAAGTCMVPPNSLKTVSSRFGIHRSAGQHGSAAKHAHPHDGLDFSTGGNTSLFATTDGKVTFKGPMGALGNTIIIERDNGHTVRYSHLKGFQPGLAVGSEVKAGDVVGIAGNTNGNPGTSMAVHLHFTYGVPNAADARAKQYPGTAAGLRSINPGQLPNAFTSKPGYMVGWRTDPSPFFCEAFPIRDGNSADHEARARILGRTTMEQYTRLYGDAPATGAPPELAAERMQLAEAADAGQPIEEWLSDADGYGALPGPPMGDYASMSTREMMFTEATRRFMSADWNNELPKLSQRALWVDYTRMVGVSNFLANANREKKERVEALLAVLTSQRLAHVRQETGAARERAVRGDAVRSIE